MLCQNCLVTILSPVLFFSSTLMCQERLLDIIFLLTCYCLRTVLLLSYHCLNLLFHTSLLSLSLELCYYYLITLLFCSSNQLLSVRGDTTVWDPKIRIMLLLFQIFLIAILSLSYFALQHFYMSEEMLLAINLELSYHCLKMSFYNLITFLFCSSTLLLCVRRHYCPLSQNYLITSLEQSYDHFITVFFSFSKLLSVRGEATRQNLITIL